MRAGPTNHTAWSRISSTSFKLPYRPFPGEATQSPLNGRPSVFIRGFRIEARAAAACGFAPRIHRPCGYTCGRLRAGVEHGEINVLSREITVQTREDVDYISLTDIARYKDAQRTDDLIRNWLRNRNTVEFLGIWEHLNNPTFNPVEFDGMKMQAGLYSFTLTPRQWIEKTGAIAARPGGRPAAPFRRTPLGNIFLNRPNPLASPSTPLSISLEPPAPAPRLPQTKSIFSS